MADNRKVLTKTEREKLEKERRHILDVERPETLNELTLARSQGDLSENADYDAAKDHLTRIESRLREIDDILDNAIDYEESEITEAKGKITIGYIVKYQEKGTKDTITVRIVGSVGADPLAEVPSVSNESPIGRALIGHSAGDTVTVEAIDSYDIKILSAERG